MPYLTHLRSHRALIAFVLLSAGLLVPHGASAAISYCRTDPIVYLSNGMKLDLTAQFSARASDLRGISYTIHTPAGVSVDKVVYTRGALGHLESLNVVADNQTPTYDTSTVVSTSTPGDSADATTRLLDQTTSAQDSGEAVGQTNQSLRVHLDAPTGGSGF